MGPYFSIGLPWPEGPHAVGRGTPGAITISGTVYDGAGAPVPDHLIEIWQADPDGRFADLHGHGGASELAGFRGFARCGAEDGDGTYEILTVKPGRVPGPGGTLQAPHIDVTVMARGMLDRVVTRIYFADEEGANAEDPVLARVPAERRATLLAPPEDGGYRFDIRLQGPGETVFFASDGAVRRHLRARRGRRGGHRARLAAGDARRRGGAGAGLRRGGPIPGAAAEEIAAACQAERFDVAALGREAADTPRPSWLWSRRCAQRCPSRRATTCTSAPPARTSSTRR